MAAANSNSKGANALSTRAMLANLSVGFWQGRKKDKKTTGEVTDNKHAEKDAGAWWTYVVPQTSIRPIVAAIDRGRGVHYRLTLPWADNGARILPAAMYFDYMGDMRKIKEEFNAAVEVFLGEYPGLVLAAQKRLGDLFHAEAFPTAADLKHKFTWNVSITPLPEAGDFRVDLGDEVIKQIKQDIEKQGATAMQQAMCDLWSRLYETVSRIAEKLKDPKPIFRDSLIENAVELCELLPKMNVTDDPSLEKMRKEVVKQLSKKDPEVLRHNKSARADAAKSASDILKQMEAFGFKPGK